MSIEERRGADPGFVAAPPARRAEEARIQAVGRALDALKPVETSIEISAAKPKPKPASAETRPAVIPASEAEARYNRFLAAARENRRAAHSRGLHPYQTEEAPALIEQARALLRLEALPADRARSLRNSVASLRRMVQQRTAALRSPRRAPNRNPDNVRAKAPRRRSSTRSTTGSSPTPGPTAPPPDAGASTPT